MNLNEVPSGWIHPEVHPTHPGDTEAISSRLNQSCTPTPDRPPASANPGLWEGTAFRPQSHFSDGFLVSKEPSERSTRPESPESGGESFSQNGNAVSSYSPRVTRRRSGSLG